MSRSGCLAPLAATLVSIGASAQESPPRAEPSSQRREKLDPHQPTTEASLRDGIRDVENLAHDLQAGLNSYHQLLTRAMQSYGHGFSDPARYQKLPSLGEDIQTDDTGQTARVRLAVFAT